MQGILFKIKIILESMLTQANILNQQIYLILQSNQFKSKIIINLNNFKLVC